MNNRSDITKKTVFCALTLAAGLVLSYIESVLPINIGIPGAKIGLPNIVTLLLLYSCGAVPALIVNIMRILLSGFMFGNLFAILYSAFGLLFSMTAMVLLKKSGHFSIFGVSCIGGVMHNVGQLAAAAIVTNAYVFSYLPVLMLSGILSGLFVGALGAELLKRLSPVIKKQFGNIWN